MTDKEFSDRAVIVTGAASGLGRASAVAFACAGAKVALADVNAAGLKETANLVVEAGGEARSRPASHGRTGRSDRRDRLSRLAA